MPLASLVAVVVVSYQVSAAGKRARPIDDALAMLPTGASLPFSSPEWTKKTCT